MIQIAELVWNERNIAHIARHNVVPDEVEDVCFGAFVILEGYDGRYVLVGTTKAGRLLSIVISLQRVNTYYVVTARSADKKERTYFRAVMKEGGESI